MDFGQGLESVLAETDRLVADYLQISHSLPAVDAEGQSECPFAEELYAKKQEAEQKLSGQLSILHTYLSAVGQEIARCKRNLVVISSHETMLNRDDARRNYTDAEVAQAAQYKQFLQKRDRIQEMIERVQDALAESQSKQFPGEEARPLPPRTDSSIGDELEHLLALGPVGKREFKAPL